ncbi:hypothetical protein B9Z55_011153 [Caenorhabditis nigoni]|uniref:Sdz-33 F-box domain-containing protein n=1 Tax=Caenorhabditis nigoni TaxID=1611254 RepID=A0A2G5UIV8_9PELO|nr:hypothetical protein B9Z55_011153 [Caenorhabditis nigoni]
MTDRRFPLRRLPDDLGSMALNAMEYHEIIAYSFLSRKAFSTVKALRLPISNVIIRMKKQPEIEMTLSLIRIKFELNMPEDDEKMTTLNGFPVSVNVSYSNHYIPGFQDILSTWTNQGKTVEEWIQHICSINQPTHCYVAIFHVREIEFDIQTLRNSFPKFFSVDIIFSQTEAIENDILSAQNVLKAYQFDSQYFRMENFPFQENLSLQHIGMANSNILEIRFPRNLRFDDFLTVNAISICLETDQMSLRDLNRFFKLWKKGSNPMLQEMAVFWEAQTIPDWNILMKGLKAKEVEAELEDMTDQGFPFLRRTDDLSSMVLESMNHYEKIAYSFLSEKAFSTVKALRLPISNVQIRMKKQPQIVVELNLISIEFELNMPEDDEKMTNLNGFPIYYQLGQIKEKLLENGFSTSAPFLNPTIVMLRFFMLER